MKLNWTGLICVLTKHHIITSTELPIAFASRSLAPTEKNYSQIDKETLDIVFGIKHFHQYLCGRKFVTKSVYYNICLVESEAFQP